MNEIEQLKREKRHLARVAIWFATHAPGELVPSWCDLAFSNGEPRIEPESLSLSEAYEQQYETT